MGLTTVDIDAKIPNNVDLAGDRRLQRALESWQPKFIEWWKAARPGRLPGQPGLPAHGDRRRPGGLGQLRPRRRCPTTAGASSSPSPSPTAASPSATTRASRCGRRCPASTAPTCAACSSSRATPSRRRSSSSGTLCLTAPSLYDLRNLFQVNVEEGRHLWAMVYLLHRYFGRDGRDEADEMLERHSGDADKPRILGAFNEPTPDWLSFFMFTYFTDRDGKFQLASLRESGVRPAVADVRLHAQGGGAPHVRRRHRRRPGRASAPSS